MEITIGTEENKNVKPTGTRSRCVACVSRSDRARCRICAHALRHNVGVLASHCLEVTLAFFHAGYESACDRACRLSA